MMMKYLHKMRTL